ncbi:MAG: hypothetical protein AAGF95_32170 [Chloroflexota bacterium]
MLVITDITAFYTLIGVPPVRGLFATVLLFLIILRAREAFSRHSH